VPASNSSTAGGMECLGREGTRGGQVCCRGPGADVELTNGRQHGALGETPVAEEVVPWSNRPRLAAGGPGPSA
jgi:hypothetical protein